MVTNPENDGEKVKLLNDLEDPGLPSSHQQQQQQQQASCSAILSTPEARYAILSNVSALVYGFSISFVAVLFSFNKLVGNCSRYSSDSASCSAMTFSNCKWRTDDNTSSSSSCEFPDYQTVNCSNFFSKDSCAHAYSTTTTTTCVWDSKTDLCHHSFGWSSSQQGILAGAQVLASMLASSIAGTLANKIGRKRSFTLSAVLALVACGLFTAGWMDAENYGLLLAAQITIGVVGGIVCVVCPNYVQEILESFPEMASTVGMMYQLFIAGGVAMAGLVGMIIGPGNEKQQESHDENEGSVLTQDTFLIMIGCQAFFSIALLIVSIVIPESPLWLRTATSTNDMTSNNNKNNDNDDEDENNQEHEKESNSIRDLFTKENSLSLVTGFVLAATAQLTGIQAVVLYSGSIVETVGVPMLLGTFLVSLLNFLSAFSPLYFVRHFSPRKLFISGTFLSSIALIIASIGVFPGIFERESSAQKAVSLLGLGLFLVFFEYGLACSFFVIVSTDIFPRRVRAMGTSYCISLLFVFMIIVNTFFPILVTYFAGGPSGEKDRGLAIMLLIFAGIGFVGATFLSFKMPKSISES